jgi:hypothetical protein
MGHAKRKLSLMLLLGIVCIVGVASDRRRTDAVADSFKPAVPLTSTQQKPRPNVEVLPLALRMTGFFPDEITRASGDFLISVTNMTRFQELDLKLERQNGERVHSGKAPKEKRAWRQHVRLQPGTYLLTAAENPDWVCQITITPQ